MITQKIDFSTTKSDLSKISTSFNKQKGQLIPLSADAQYIFQFKLFSPGLYSVD